MKKTKKHKKAQDKDKKNMRSKQPPCKPAQPLIQIRTIWLRKLCSYLKQKSYKSKKWHHIFFLSFAKYQS